MLVIAFVVHWLLSAGAIVFLAYRHRQGLRAKDQEIERLQQLNQSMSRQLCINSTRMADAMRLGLPRFSSPAQPPYKQ